jgi:hypothetical protein
MCIINSDLNVLGFFVATVGVGLYKYHKLKALGLCDTVPTATAAAAATADQQEQVRAKHSSPIFCHVTYYRSLGKLDELIPRKGHAQGNDVIDLILWLAARRSASRC